jgi:hypothetical protein
MLQSALQDKDTKNQCAMLHEFWLLQATEWSYGEQNDIAFLRTHPTRITIPDDLIWYIHDSLEWVETVNPSNSKNWKGTGLNMYGPTIITESGAARLASILTVWADLFDNGPPILQLSGLWTYDTDEEGKKSSGKYNVITIERDIFVTTLRTLAEYAHKAQEDNTFILHFGL